MTQLIERWKDNGKVVGRIVHNNGNKATAACNAAR
jgi:hypothetical protein